MLSRGLNWTEDSSAPVSLCAGHENEGVRNPRQARL